MPPSPNPALEPLHGGWWRGENSCLDGRSRPFLVHVPTAAAPPSGYPTLLSLHGGVMRPKVLTAEGIIPKLERRFGTWLDDTVLLAPASNESAPWWHPFGAHHVLASLEQVSAGLPTDPDRVVCLGHSDGAAGAYFLASHHPTSFAAFVCVNGWLPMAEGGRIRFFPRNLSAKPVFVAHGARDESMPITEVHSHIASLRERGVPVAFHEVPDAGHSFESAWDPVRRDARAFIASATRNTFPEVIDWETDAPARGQCHWLHIEEVGGWSMSGRVRANWHGDTVSCTTFNVSRFSLRFPALHAASALPFRVPPQHIVVDGVDVRAVPDATSAEIRMEPTSTPFR